MKTRISDHFDGRQFHNLDGPAGQPFSRVPRMLLERRARWPRHVDVVPQQPPPLGDASAQITFIGHSTFLIQTRAATIITDPIYSKRAGPFGILGPRRVREPAVRFEDLPKIDLVLLSHNHYDHCDVSTLRMIAKRFDPLVVTALGNGTLVRSTGIKRVEELDWWDTSTLAPMKIMATPARHFSARHPFDKNRALWCGFTITAGDRTIYFAGDSAYGPHFRQIQRRASPIDLALIPVGAYEPRWFMNVVHVNPAEAVQAFVDVQARQAIAMHFGTFQLTAEAIDEPVRALGESLLERGLSDEQFFALEFGGSFALP